MIDELILVRHGETVHNAAGITQGWNDSELSDSGQRQVARLAKRIALEKPDAIFSSPLQRALTTAAAIGNATGVPVQTLDELREMSYGGWEGRSFLDIRRDDDEKYRQWIRDADYPCPGGESHNDVLRRMKRAFEQIQSLAANARRVAVVTHGTAIRIGTTSLLNAPIEFARHLAIDNAAISVFIRRGDRLLLKLWNDTSHCDGA